MDGLKDRFSKNLRILSSTKRSQAEIAEALGVNRHQFSAYIRGVNLPNDSIVRKICEYFQIDVADLFTKDLQLGGQRSDFVSQRQINTIRRSLTWQIRSDWNLLDGKYLVYFLDPRQRRTVKGSFLAIRTRNETREFRRITRLMNTDRQRHDKMRVHAGVVFSSQNRELLFGTQTVDEPVISLMICKPILSESVLFSGKSIVSIPSRYVEVDFVIPRLAHDYSTDDYLARVKTCSASSGELHQGAVEHLLDKDNFKEW